METIILLSTGLTHGIHVSQITLDPDESTQNHYYKNTTELYTVLSGSGMITQDKTIQHIKQQDSIIIGPNTFHQITNTGFEPLILLSCKDKPRQSKDYHTS